MRADASSPMEGTLSLRAVARKPLAIAPARSGNTPAVFPSCRAIPPSGYAAAIWLVSVGTAVSFFAAVVGAALALAVMNVPPALAVIIGAATGWVLSSLVFGAAAERLDRRLHRIGGGGPSRRRRR